MNTSRIGSNIIVFRRFVLCNQALENERKKKRKKKKKKKKKKERRKKVTKRCNRLFGPPASLSDQSLTQHIFGRSRAVDFQYPDGPRRVLGKAKKRYLGGPGVLRHIGLNVGH